MKYLCIISTFLFFAVSCNHESGPAPESVADDFLTAYYQVDFDRISSLCVSGSVLRSDMERNAQSFNGYAPEVQDKWRNDLAAYSFRIEQVYSNRAKDSAFVSYTIFAPEAPEGIASRLTLIKEESEWRVAGLL